MAEQAKNLNQALLMAMDTYAGQSCFQVNQSGRYQDVSYRRFQTLTFHMVRFFRDQGISNGERVAIVAYNSLEWMVTYVACLLSGGVAVPLRISLTPETLRFVLQDAEVRLAVLQDKTHIQALSASLSTDAGDPLPGLKTILTVGDKGDTLPGVISIDTVLAETSPLTAETQEAIRSHAEGILPQDLALISYVPSESGYPRGAVFDHAQQLLAVGQIAEWFTFEDDDLAFTIAPWSETSSRLAGLHYFLSGIANALLADFDQVLENMQQTSPTVMISSPFTFDAYYEQSMNWLAEQPESNQKVFQWALAKSREYRSAGSDASPELREKYLEADLTFFSQIRGQVGGRFRRVYSTGGQLRKEVAEFFEAIDLALLDVYSQTEAGGFPVVSRPEAYRLGSCGQVVPGFQVRIAGDAEILIQGETVMREYWQRPEETQQVIDVDGWLHTGDEGYFDEDGFLYITGRKRHIMVTSMGRKFMPTVIENALTASPYIAQAAIFGEGKPYVSAMIVPDLEALVERFQAVTGDDGRPVATTTHPKVKALLDEVIGKVNSKLDRQEHIREYSLLDQPLSRDAGELTASMKISRHVVAERYAAQIQAMYPTAAQIGAQEVSQVQVEPERLRELLEKEDILDAWMEDAGIEFLFDLARQKQIDAQSMVHICDAAATIAQMENEEIPLSTAFIVGDPIRIARELPASQIKLLYSDHIRRMRNVLVTMAKMVDGLVLGYLVDRYGYVRGIHKLEHIKADDSDSFLGPQFQRHATISKECDAVVFFVPTGGRQVRVFAEGQMVGRYSSGDWSPERMNRVGEIVTDLAQQKSYDMDLVRRVLQCAFQMSEENLGAIFVLGEADTILDRSDTSEISSFAAIISADIKHLSDRELINFAKQDGATVIDMQGQFRGCMVLLRPDANTQAEIGPGKGARHSSAAKMSAEAKCLAITVSQDGPITVYDSGRRVLSL